MKRTGMKMLKRLLLVSLLSLPIMLIFEHISAHQLSNETVVLEYFKDEEISDNWLDSFIQPLASNLQKHNILLEIIENESCCKQSPSVRANFRISDNNLVSIIVSVNPEINLLTPKSEFLTNANGYYFASSAEEDSVPNFFNDLATGISLFAINRCDIADAYLAKAEAGFANPSQKINVRLLRGNCAILQEDFTTAVSHFENALKQSIDEYGFASFELALNLGWTYLQIGDVDKAVHLVSNSIYPEGEIDWSAYARQLERTAEFYALAGRYDGAIYYYTEAMNQGEYFIPEQLSTRANYYAHNKQYDEAISDLTIAIELSNEDTPDLYILRGQMYLALYEWDSALADYNMAIELDPDYADAYYERGVLYYSILQTGIELRTDALADFQKYLELAPEGEKADDAARYVEQIETELEALNG